MAGVHFQSNKCKTLSKDMRSNKTEAKMEITN
jgi:hypothetical protein